MRQTYVAPEEITGRAKRCAAGPRRNRPHTAGPVALASSMDAAAIAFAAILLWLGAGTTVLSGQPVVMTLAFAGGAVLAALSNLLVARSGTRSAVSMAVIATLALAALYAVRIIVLPSYFLSWVVVFAGAYVAARTAVLLVVDAFAGRATGALIWRLLAISAGLAAVVLLNDVWADNMLLADLVVFVVLLALAGVVIELGIRSFRASRRTAD